MRSRLLAFPALLLLACSGGKTSSAPPVDDGGGGSSSGGGEDGGGTSTQSYTPQGCQYTFTAPQAFNDQNWAPDDTGPVDATNGVPQRVRVGLGGGTTKGKPGYADPTTTAAFTWETAENDHAAKVKYGTSASSLTQVQTGVTWTVQPPIGSQAANFHEVHVCGLTPNTTYFYAVGGGPSGQEIWSATQSFTTMPSSGPIEIAVFGDARDKDTTWTGVHQRMKNEGILMSLVGGDVVDIGGDEQLYQQWLGDIWQDPSNQGKFLTLGQQYILPINGNHENDTTPSFANWAIPSDDPQYGKTYASFDVGPAHFTMIDDEQIATSTEGNPPPPPSAEAQAQLAWIDSDLKAAQADKANHPFIIVISHRGLFSTSLHSTDGDVVAARGQLAPLFDKYGVSLVMNGHDHEYERTVPINAGSPPTGDPVPNASGTTYVIAAGAGADPYAVGTTSVSWRATKTAFGSGTPYIGLYTILKISSTQIALTAYGMNASSTTLAGDTVIDTVTLTH